MELGIYRHYKGKLYEVTATAKHTETLEEMVVYRDLKDQYWARPLSMFLEQVEVDGVWVPRFEKAI